MKFIDEAEQRRTVFTGFSDSLSHDSLVRALVTKSSSWKHEREWRYVRTPGQAGGSGAIEVAAGAIAEVLLGVEIEASLRARVMSLARALPDEPSVLQAVLSADRYEINFEPV